MDLVAAAHAFLHVAERSSFTTGAQAAGLSQSAASRRVGALERHLGTQLVDRSHRRLTVTPVGLRLLPEVRRLLEVAQRIDAIADAALSEPVELLVPDHWQIADLADLCLAAQDAGVDLDVSSAAPDHRRAALETGSRVALLPCVAEAGTWRIPLGLASAVDGPATARLEQLRTGRGGGSRRPTVWVLPEDDAPHVRDPLEAAAAAVGLAPSQVAVAGHPAQALARVLGSNDRLVTSAAEARRLGLSWSPLRPALSRGYRLAGSDPRLGTVAPALGPILQDLLGAVSPAAGTAGAP
ncbi:LysR family transcriptional regulator [Phycicoccus sp. CSK15P-2]|uniref:LysR family transcriptional regulator n=1 Tax=Phycicoccus sp. CSK15P-2 TaxID=2807627 RepID=UPI0019526CD5|nr:LysR family transcriptional regulator [Phycicoccus sp. CSK15P-2]MBM6403086.1 LysR family transcriptional regulator [Phycicoccus sp. CSK15P-2]